jgi:hypothetical protein
MVMPVSAVPAQVRIPDQRALIQFSNGVERLVIETRFTGAGTNFAWVVPLPSAPVIEEASTGLFPTLQSLFQPRLRHDVPHYFQFFLALIPGGYLLRLFRRRTRVNGLDVVAALVSGWTLFAGEPVGAIASVLLLFCILYVVDHARARDFCWFECFLFLSGILILGFFGLAMVAPRLTKGTAAMNLSAAPAVSVLDRRVVGVFETTTISSREPAALQEWLKTNGFSAPTNRNDAIASYVRDGWVFVAAKIRRDVDTLEMVTPHPLSFTFKTGKAVYPMRLTGIDNGPLKVDLYVFGSDRAEAPYLEVERCDKPEYPVQALQHEVDFDSFKTPETLKIVHPLLRKWVDGTPVATKLTATLSPEQMRDDVWISWVPFSQKETFRYSRQGAWMYAVNWGSGVLAAIMLPGLIFGGTSGNRAKRLIRYFVVGLGAGITAASAVYAELPQVEVRFVKAYDSPAFVTFLGLKLVPIVTSQESNLMEARTRLESVYRPGDLESENFLSGGLIHEEDSPGNYQLRQFGPWVMWVVYDACGEPCSE